MTLPRLLSPAQVAKVLGCTPAHVRALCRGGVLVAANIATKARAEDGEKEPRAVWVIPESELVALLVARGLVASDAVVETDATDASVDVAAVRERVSGSKR